MARTTRIVTSIAASFLLFACSSPPVGPGPVASEAPMRTAEGWLTPDQVITEFRRVEALERSDQVTIDPKYEAMLNDSGLSVPLEGDTVAPTNAPTNAPTVHTTELRAQALPPQGTTVDLRHYSRAPLNQEGPFCSAFSVAGAMQVAANIQGDKDNISPGHLWKLQRHKQSIDASIATARTNWLTGLDLWGENAGGPKRSLKPEDSFAKLRGGRAINNVEGVLRELDAKHPVLIASGFSRASLYKGNLGALTKVAFYTPKGHAYSIVGYVVDSRAGGGGYLIIKNSWGPGWADGGFAYMEFDYCSQNAYCYFYSVDGVDILGGSASACDGTPEREPNDTTASANPLTASACGGIDTPDDFDWYKTDRSTPTTTFRVESVGKKDANLRVWRAEGNSYVGVPATEINRVPVTAPGRYVIGVWSPGKTLQRYRLVAE